MKNLLAVFCAVALSGCAQGQPCSSVNEIAGNPASIQKIEHWVDGQREGLRLGARNTIPGHVSMPGRYSIAVPSALQWTPKVEARVITEPDGTPKAIFLGDYNFQGLVVKFDTKDNSLLPRNKLKPITQRTSLICIQRD
jgi:hypothetical protein